MPLDNQIVIDIPDGDVRCGECNDQPILYFESYGICCPDCRGTGHHADPDTYDASGDFDARREYSTMPRLRGNGRAQL